MWAKTQQVVSDTSPKLVRTSISNDNTSYLATTLFRIMTLRLAPCKLAKLIWKNHGDQTYVL